MSGLAEILLTMNCRVTGSDLKRSPITDRLRRKGARIYFGHRPENIGKAQVVVTSSAVSKKNAEVDQAIKSGIPVIARAAMLAELMRLKYGIAVAGSHGKTTTTSLVASVLEAGGLDPTMIIGGRVKSLRSNAKLGKGDFLVAEADESDGSFLHLDPTIAVVTNIDREHMDHYRDFEALRETFEKFISKIPFYGLGVFCADHPETGRLASLFTKRGVTYGLREKADYQVKDVRLKGWGSEFEVKYQGQSLGKMKLNLPGLHNVSNSLAAIAVGRELGVSMKDIRRALSNFRGIGRRLEKVHEGTITIVDDYGHHPVEIQATLKAVKDIAGSKKVWVLFQPHRFTRTKDLFEDFVNSFDEADALVVSEIYAAGEDPIRGVSGASLVEAIQKGNKGKSVQFVSSVSSMADLVLPQLQEGDFVLTLGAGDIWKAGRDISKKWK